MRERASHARHHATDQPRAAAGAPWARHASRAAAGLPPHLFGAHSLRIGGATAALSAGGEPSQIRLMGRWSSDVYEVYCRMSEAAALRVGAAIGSAAVRPEALAFHEEHLELLPQELATVGRVFEGLVDGDEEEAA